MKVLIVALVASAMALTACTSADPSPTPSAIHSASELAAAAKCTDFVRSADGDELIEDSGDCAIDGVEAHVMVFVDDKSRDQWLQSIQAAEYMGNLVVGERWVLRSASINVAREAASAAGGKLLATSAKPTAGVVSCPGGNVNSGTVDQTKQVEQVTDISEHAIKWAKATGFADRYPAARVSVREDEQSAFAKFDDGGVRAQLTYRRIVGGWTLDTLEYC